jgi:predicted nuclease with RNAse H fold
MSVGSTVTLGVDLAAQAANTAICVIDWARPEVTAAALGVDDDPILSEATTAHRVAIDAPFGWPDDFVAFVDAHRAGNPARWSTKTERLRLRETDLAVEKLVGLTPLSVSTNLIGITAFRCARLLDRLAEVLGQPVDRSGAGKVVEVYPAAALRRWGLPHRGYKKTEGRELLAELASQVMDRSAVRVAPRHRSLIAERHDVFDAFVCALVARAADLRLTDRPAAEDMAVVRREGWIHVPGRDSLEQLAGSREPTQS